MVGPGRLDVLIEPVVRRVNLGEEQVGRATTVGSPKPQERDQIPIEVCENLRPLMFAPQRIVGVPDLAGRHEWVKVVEVPVWMLNRPHVATYARFHAPWSESTTHVEIESWFDGESTQSSDLQLPREIAVEQQDVGSGTSLHHPRVADSQFERLIELRRADAVG
jgi:hypothetical protein